VLLDFEFPDRWNPLAQRLLVFSEGMLEAFLDPVP
jgi:hypothetical protein